MRPALQFTLLLLAWATLSALASEENLHSYSEEPQLIAAIKRQQFKYYKVADDLIEFRRSYAPQLSSDIDEEKDVEDNGYISSRYRRRSHTVASPADRTQGGWVAPPPRSAVLELLVVVDNGLYESHLSRIATSKSKQSVKFYYEYFVGYINKVFESALPNFKVTVVPAGIAVIKHKNPKDWSERNRVTVNGQDFILAKEALKEFRLWLNRHKGRLPPFDHAMALTQYRTGIRIGDTVHEIKGIAQLGQMCRVDDRINSVSLVHDAMTLAGALTAVHEIAHSFGVNHDGERESAQCPDDGQFVMSAALAMSETATKFSNCSQQMLLRFLESRDAECLFRSRDDPASRLVQTNVLPGHIYSKDFQCQKQAPAGYKEPRFCRIPWFAPTTLESSCSSLYCQDGDSMRCAGSVPAIMGTPCGNKKVCLNNRCTFSPTAPCCPLEEEDAEACTRMRGMGLRCTHTLMQQYCCKFCDHKCD